MIMIETIKEVLWLKNLFGKLNLHQGVTTIYYDSQNAIHLTKYQMYHESSKHTDLKFHFIRDTVVEGKILIQKISTNENPADMFMKFLLVYKFKQCLGFLGVGCW